MRTSLQFALIVAGALPAAFALSATSVTPRISADHVVVELVSESVSLKPGARAWIGLKFTHDPHWHTYWVNPGDSGLPTRLEWQLPAGFKALDPEWPAPKRIAYGDLYNFGYEGVTLLPVPIEVPAGATTAEVTFAVNARWLICNDVCIPGKAALSIKIPVTKTEPAKNPAVTQLFANARAARPVKATAQSHLIETKDQITVELRGTNLPPGDLDVFPSAQKLFMNSPFKVTRSGNTVTLIGQRSEYFESAPDTLTLVVTRKSPASGTPSGWQFDIPWPAQKKPVAR